MAAVVRRARTGQSAQPDQFNLLVVYNPPSGGVGVTLPVIVEQFNNVSLDNVADQFDAELRTD